VTLLAGCADEKKLERESKYGFMHAAIQEKVLYDMNDLKITAVALNMLPDSGPTLVLSVENLSEKRYGIKLKNSSVNGYMIYDDKEYTIPKGFNDNIEVIFNPLALNAAGIVTFTEMNIGFQISEVADESLYESDPVIVTTSMYGKYIQKYQFSGSVVINEGGLVIKVASMKQDDALFGKQIYIYVENNTENPISLETKDVSVNGIELPHYFIREIGAGKRACEPITFHDSDLVTNGVASIDELIMGFKAFSPYGSVVDTQRYKMLFSENEGKA
jgi:hypothetical protein